MCWLGVQVRTVNKTPAALASRNQVASYGPPAIPVIFNADIIRQSVIQHLNGGNS